MFEVLLKEKIKIEAKVSALQQTYIDIMKISLREIASTDKNNVQAAEKLLNKKIKDLENIKKEYKELLHEHKKFAGDLSEAKEAVTSLEVSLDEVFTELNFDIPDDLKTETDNNHISVHELQEEDKENSTYCKEEDSLEDCDYYKEDSSLQLASSGEYFSPDIQIQKSFGSSTAGCCTPAFKHSSKRILKFHN